MAALKGSKTEGNLKDAFAGESQANRRYLYFAQKADVEGYNDVAAVFRSTAEGEIAQIDLFDLLRKALPPLVQGYAIANQHLAHALLQPVDMPLLRVSSVVPISAICFVETVLPALGRFSTKGLLTTLSS